MTPGLTIFLNGTSSAGKTSLAHALQEVITEPYVHVALDQFRDGLPDKFRGLNAAPGTNGYEGLNVVPVIRDDKPFTEIQFGDTGRQMLKGMRRAMAGMAREGNNVIIDDILLERSFLQDYVEAFAGLKVVFVGVRCPLAVINAREKARPGRFPGTAYGHYHSCHADHQYDIEVNTSEHSPRDCARQVLDFMQRNEPKSFANLAQAGAFA
jgi:chloramphenicol 3-O phosphotransferase